MHEYMYVDSILCTSLSAGHNTKSRYITYLATCDALCTMFCRGIEATLESPLPSAPRSYACRVPFSERQYRMFRELSTRIWTIGSAIIGINVGSVSYIILCVYFGLLRSLYTKMYHCERFMTGSNSLVIQKVKSELKFQKKHNYFVWPSK